MPARFAVNRPITVLMATLAVATFGFLAARRLPVELLPDLSYPTLTIQTEYQDAAPLTVEQFITRPIEESVGVIAGVRDLRSTSRAGLSEVILEFDWGEEMDFAAIDVRERVGLVDLPREAEIPRVLRYDPSLEPIVRMAFVGERPLDELRQLGERWLKPRLEAIQGVAAAKIRGGFDPEIVVEANEDRLAALGLTLADLAGALQAENINRPGGRLKDFNAVYLVRTLHEFTELDQVRRTVVRETPAGRVRVEDVATVQRGHRDRDEITRFGGREMVEVDLHREGSANTVAVAEAIRASLAELRREIPDGLELTILADQSRYISEAVSQVWNAALLGGVLAVLVLYFFLRDPRATAIIAVTIPLSVVATFLPLQRAGVSLNIMSLGGLALGVGMLVDNSIVVLEAIDRHRRLRRDRREAAIRGAGEVTGAVTASTLTTVSVFLPIVFVQGIAGQLFYDMAVTVCLSLLVSLIVSLTVIPSVSSLSPGTSRGHNLHTLLHWNGDENASPRPMTFRLGGLSLPPLGDGRHAASRVVTAVAFPLRLAVLVATLALGALWWAFSWAFHTVAAPIAAVVDRLGRAYPGRLATAVRHRVVVLAVAFVLLALSLAAIPRLGINLVPDLAQGEFAFQLRFPEGTPLETTASAVARVEDVLAADPRFERVFSIAGSLPSAASGRRMTGENLAQINVTLPDGARAQDEAQAVARVREVLGLLVRGEAELVRPAVLAVRRPIAVQLFSDSLEQLDRGESEVRAALERLPGIRDVATTSEPGNPEIRIELDRERAAALGVSAEMVGGALRTQVRGDVVGQFREGEERIDIRLRASEAFRSRASDIPALRVLLSGGTAVPVSAVADVTVERGPAAIYRAGGGRVAEVSATTTAALASTLEQVRNTLAGLDLPPGVRVELAGQNEEMRVSFSSLWLALALATFLVYVVMASQFESLLHPFVILMAVPLGVVGIVVALLLTGTEVSVLVLIGAVMLAGIVVNNAIVLIDAVNRRRREGQEMDEALVAAGRERLRPILMTTATTVLALLPMALGLGAGDELRAPLAVTVIGGLLAATLLTLVVTPCLYRVLAPARIRSAASRIESGRRADDGGADGPRPAGLAP